MHVRAIARIITVHRAIRASFGVVYPQVTRSCDWVRTVFVAESIVQY